MPKFSIAIPNYNYGKYIVETIDSVRSQSIKDLEILVSDNASSDDSAELVRQLELQDHRVRLRVNRRNVGFFENLKLAAAPATGTWMNLLSSDDLMNDGALEKIAKLVDSEKLTPQETIITSAVDIVDGASLKTDILDFKKEKNLWGGAVLDAPMSELVGCDVWVIDAKILLARCLNKMRTPFAFCATVYPKEIYDAVEGYSHGGLINPDKRFAWAILSRAKTVIYIDSPLFSYRVHSANQGSQQQQSGALKHIVDQYTATFETDRSILDSVLMTYSDLQVAFMREDIGLRGLLVLSEGARLMASRIFHFGKAAYPGIKNKEIRTLKALLMLGPLGVLIAKAMKYLYMRFNARNS
jgi:glycosyltransferase involved in cell wall biosynthesis